MSLLHSCLVARVRRPVEGQPTHVILAESNHLGGEPVTTAGVVEAYHRLMSSAPEAADDRRRFSHAVLIVDNGLRASHEFPDVDEQAASRRHKQQVRESREAKRLADRAYEEAKKALAKAKGQRTAAQRRVDRLAAPPAVTETATETDTATTGATAPKGGEKKSSNPTHETPASPSAGDGGEGGVGGSGGDGDDPAPDLDRLAARLETGDEVSAEELVALGEPALRTLADRYEIEIPDDADAAAIVAILLPPDEGDEK